MTQLEKLERFAATRSPEVRAKLLAYYREMAEKLTEDMKRFDPYKDADWLNTLHGNVPTETLPDEPIIVDDPKSA